MYTLFSKSQNQPPYLLLRRNEAEPLGYELVALFARDSDAISFARIESETAAPEIERIDGDLQRMVANAAERFQGISDTMHSHEDDEVAKTVANLTDNQRRVFEAMRKHADPTGLLSMSYMDISGAAKVPDGSICTIINRLTKRGLAMVARPGIAGKKAVYQVANGQLLNQGV